MKKEHIIGTIITILILSAIIYTAYQAWCKRFAGRVVALKNNVPGNIYTYSVASDVFVRTESALWDDNMYVATLTGAYKTATIDAGEEDSGKGIVLLATTIPTDSGNVAWVRKQDVTIL